MSCTYPVGKRISKGDYTLDFLIAVECNVHDQLKRANLQQAYTLDSHFYSFIVYSEAIQVIAFAKELPINVFL